MGLWPRFRNRALRLHRRCPRAPLCARWFLPGFPPERFLEQLAGFVAPPPLLLFPVAIQLPHPPPAPDSMSNETVGLAILAAGALALLSVMQATSGAAPLLRQVLGWGALPLSLAGALAGLLLIVRRFVTVTWHWPLVVGVELLLVALLALTHLWWGGDDPLRHAQAGRGGGYLGWALSSLLHDIVGDGVSALLLIVLAAAGGYLILRPIWQSLLLSLLHISEPTRPY